MRYQLILIDKERMSQTAYSACTLGVDLVARSHSFMYNSIWFELSQEDLNNYNNLSQSCTDLTYLKILDEKREVLYSGIILSAEELQSKLKSFTLENLALDKDE